MNFGDTVFGYENNQKQTDAPVELGKSPAFYVGSGFYLNDNISLGARYAYRRTSSNTTTPDYSVDSKFRSHALTAEAAYHFTNDSDFTPYAKVGLGIARNSYSAYLRHAGSGFPEGTKTNFTWSVGAGIDYQINKNISVLAEYQYSDLGALSTKKVFTLTSDHAGTENYRVSEVNVGIRIRF